MKWQHGLKRLKFGTKHVLWEPKENDAVCSLHFSDKDFVLHGQRKRLKEDAIPKQFVGSEDRNEQFSLECPPSTSRAAMSGTLEDKVQNLRLRLKTHRDKLRNARKREDRLRLTVGDVLDQLNEQKRISEDLRSQLENFEGKTDSSIVFFISTFQLCA